jgi:hypothetical protein
MENKYDYPFRVSNFAYCLIYKVEFLMTFSVKKEKEKKRLVICLNTFILSKWLFVFAYISMTLMNYILHAIQNVITVSCPNVITVSCLNVITV